MCNIHFIKYITFNQKQMRVGGGFDGEQNLIDNRQVFKEGTGLTGARDGTKKGKRKIKRGRQVCQFCLVNL